MIPTDRLHTVKKTPTPAFLPESESFYPKERKLLLQSEANALIATEGRLYQRLIARVLLRLFLLHK